MSRFDEDTSMMRTRLASTSIDLRKQEHEPPTRMRGIAFGAALGLVAWVAIITLGMAVWRWITE
jgi:hypothetical protein